MHRIDSKEVQNKGALLEPYRLKTPECSEQEWKLLLQQLSEDPAQRYTAEGVVDRCFIANNLGDSVLDALLL